jgi:hypothetical protein
MLLPLPLPLSHYPEVVGIFIPLPTKNVDAGQCQNIRKMYVLYLTFNIVVRSFPSDDLITGTLKCEDTGKR